MACLSDSPKFLPASPVLPDTHVRGKYCSPSKCYRRDSRCHCLFGSLNLHCQTEEWNRRKIEVSEDIRRVAAVSSCRAGTRCGAIGERFALKNSRMFELVAFEEGHALEYTKKLRARRPTDPALLSTGSHRYDPGQARYGGGYRPTGRRIRYAG